MVQAATARATTVAQPLQLDITNSIQEMVTEIVAFLPQLLAAVVILLIGWLVGKAVAKLVGSLTDRVELDRAVLDTPLGKMLGDSEGAVSHTFGVIAKWFVYGLAILAAANVLAIPTLSEWVQTAISYLPAFLAGLVVIVLGFVVADFIGDAIMRTRAATHTSYTKWFATGTRMFLYFTAIVIGLDTMGIDVSILYVFANAFAWGLAAAIALGAGIALGWGGHTYVQDNIDRWMGQANSATPQPQSATDGGTDQYTSTDGGTDEQPSTDGGTDEQN